LPASAAEKKDKISSSYPRKRCENKGQSVGTVP